MNDEKTASAGDFVRDLGEAIRANPVPAALIGMGLAWLFTGGRSSAKASFGWARGSMTHFRSKDDGEPTPRLRRSLDDPAGQSLGDNRFGAVGLSRINEQGSGFKSLPQRGDVALVIEGSKTNFRHHDSSLAQLF